MPSLTEVFNDLTLGRGTKVLRGADVLDPNYDTEGAPGHVFVEFFGVCMLTVITTGAVLSTGSLAVKYDLEELRPGRIFGIALANAAVYISLLVAISGLRRVGDRSKSTVRLSKHIVGHFNPATSLACAIVGQITLRTAMFYSLAQLIGAITGSLIVLMSWSAMSPVPTLLGANIPHANAQWWEGLFVEITMSFAFHMTILFLLAREERKVVSYTSAEVQMDDKASTGPTLAGIILMLGNSICIAVSGGSMNPARSFGPAVVAGVWRGHWMYWIGPYMGAIFAAYFYLRIEEIKKAEESKSS